MTGFVSLVGAGPGDPELLTRRGLARLQAADVVLHDALIDPRVLELCAPGAERIDVGKRAGHTPVSQEAINALLVEKARAGRRVVRLKGGDPFVFGRGGEEIAALSEASIPWEVVPGVSSVLAAPAAAGISVTHRTVASSLVVTSAHRRDDAPPRDWRALRAAAETLVVVMGSLRLEAVCRELIDAGWDAATPAALVVRASWPDEQRIIATLDTLGAEAARQNASTPATLIVGRVVGAALTSP